jgi:endonuclease YncB( thermonuclease family)
MHTRSVPQGAADSVAPFWLRLLPLCAVLLCSPFTTSTAGDCPARQIDERVQVIYVFDGDTVKLTDGRRVRLIGINTPEMGRKSRQEEPFAGEARASLKDLLDNNNRILLLQHGNDNHDHYGRLLAHAFLDNGDNVAARLLKRGMATTLVVPPNTWAMDCYQRLENTARIDKAGLWAQKKYQARDSRELSADMRGYAIVYGTVNAVRPAKRTIWIDLEGPLTVRISNRDQVNFAPGYLEQLEGQTVEVRGWIKPDRESLRMNVQHPAALTIVTTEHN